MELKKKKNRMGNSFHFLNFVCAPSVFILFYLFTEILLKFRK